MCGDWVHQDRLDPVGWGLGFVWAGLVLVTIGLGEQAAGVWALALIGAGVWAIRRTFNPFRRV